MAHRCGAADLKNCVPTCGESHGPQRRFYSHDYNGTIVFNEEITNKLKLTITTDFYSRHIFSGSRAFQIYENVEG